MGLGLYHLSRYGAWLSKALLGSSQMGLRLAVLVTGASGMLLPIHALRLLSAEDSVEALHLVISAGAFHPILLLHPGQRSVGMESRYGRLVHNWERQRKD